MSSNYNRPCKFTKISNEIINGEMDVQIETVHLLIRSYNEADIEHAIRLYGDARQSRFFDNGKPKSPIEVKRMTDEILESFSRKGSPFGLFSIFRKEDMKFVGFFDLLPFSNCPGIVEIGCIFDRKQQNQGYCPEVARAFLYNYILALNEKGYKSNGAPIHKVIATAHPSNIASQKHIQNIGMTFEKEEERFGQPRNWYSIEYKSNMEEHKWNAEAYKQNSSVQLEAAHHLIQKISWRGNEKILDVGCGDGKITAAIARLIQKGEILGIDISLDMISFAKKNFPKEIYPNLSFVLQDAMQISYTNKFDIVFSSFALQWVHNISSFIQKAYQSLLSSGLFVATIPIGISSALESSVQTVLMSPEWAPYFEGKLESIPKFLTENEYREVLTRNYFQILSFETIIQEIHFPSKEALEKYILQWFIYLKFIPPKKKDEFFRQIIDRYFMNEPISSTNKVIFKFPRIDFIAKKNQSFNLI